MPACHLPTQEQSSGAPQAAATTQGCWYQGWGCRLHTNMRAGVHAHARARTCTRAHTLPELTEVFAQDLKRLLQELLHGVAFFHLQSRPESQHPGHQGIGRGRWRRALKKAAPCRPLPGTLEPSLPLKDPLPCSPQDPEGPPT